MINENIRRSLALIKRNGILVRKCNNPVPEEISLIVLESNYDVCMNKNNRDTKYTSNIKEH